MTEDELKVIEVTARTARYYRTEILALVAEVRRLQGWAKATKKELEQAR